MGCRWVLAVLSVLYGTGCTLVFDEGQYLDSGAGGAAVCDDETCVPSPLPVYLIAAPDGDGAQAKVAALQAGGRRIELEKPGAGEGKQECRIAQDAESVLIGCLATVDEFYLLVELEGAPGFAAHLITASDAFTTSCESFDCTGSDQSGSILQPDIGYEVEGDAVLIVVPVTSLGPTFDLALEIGSTAPPAAAPAVYPSLDGGAAAKTFECTQPATCQSP